MSSERLMHLPHDLIDVAAYLTPQAYTSATQEVGRIMVNGAFLQGVDAMMYNFDRRGSGLPHTAGKLALVLYERGEPQPAGDASPRTRLNPDNELVQAESLTQQARSSLTIHDASRGRSMLGIEVTEWRESLTRELVVSAFMQQNPHIPSAAARTTIGQLLRQAKTPTRNPLDMGRVLTIAEKAEQAYPGAIHLIRKPWIHTNYWA
jgi:hypothetical protein